MKWKLVSQKKSHVIASVRINFHEGKICKLSHDVIFFQRSFLYKHFRLVSKMSCTDLWDDSICTEFLPIIFRTSLWRGYCNGKLKHLFRTCIPPWTNSYYSLFQKKRTFNSTHTTSHPLNRRASQFTSGPYMNTFAERWYVHSPPKETQHLV